VAAATVGSAAAVVVRGNPLFALAACWGQVGIAVKTLQHRQTPVVTAAAVGALAVATSSAIARSITRRQ